jgi:hypothetical protein
MLFDLRGRRRRAVQAIYLMLALLMGGGLVLFGIGGDVSGGLVDAFKGGGSGDSGNEVLEERIDRQEERLVANPSNAALMQSLIRDYYSLATGQRESGSVGFPEEARDELREAGSYWTRYVRTVDEPSADTAQYALQIYAPEALNRPREMARAAQIVAAEQNDFASYLFLVEAAAAAGDERTADLAADKAVELAPEDQKEAVRKEAEARKKPPPQQQPGG